MTTAEAGSNDQQPDLGGRFERYVWALSSICKHALPRRLERGDVTIREQLPLDAISNTFVQRCTTLVTSAGVLAPSIAETQTRNPAKQLLRPCDVLALLWKGKPESWKTIIGSETDEIHLDTRELSFGVVRGDLVPLVIVSGAAIFGMICRTRELHLMGSRGVTLLILTPLCDIDLAHLNDIVLHGRFRVSRIKLAECGEDETSVPFEVTSILVGKTSVLALEQMIHNSALRRRWSCLFEGAPTFVTVVACGEIHSSTQVAI